MKKPRQPKPSDYTYPIYMTEAFIRRLRITLGHEESELYVAKRYKKRQSVREVLSQIKFLLAEIDSDRIDSHEKSDLGH